MSVNKLSLNVSKTKFMLFTPGLKSKQNLNTRIIILNTPIDQVNSANFLGVIVDDKLNWKEHIKNVKLKIARCIGVLPERNSRKDFLIIILEEILKYINITLDSSMICMHINSELT